MLSKVEVRTDQGLLLTLSLQDILGGYFIKSIDGLDPVKATLTYSSMANQDDEVEQNAKLEKRNIIMKLGLDPDWAMTSFGKLRRALYSFFPPKGYVRLRFYNDEMPVVEIRGRVESNDAPLFTQDPDVTISLLCAKSSFVGMDTQQFGGNTISSGNQEVARTYDGTDPTGFLFRLLVNRALSSFTLYNRDPAGNTQSQQFGNVNLQAGDILEINSVALSKAATLTRSGSQQSVLYGVSPYSQWINLLQGVNNLRVVAAGAAIPWTVSYLNKYGGL